MAEPKKPTIKGMNLAALGQGAEVQEKAVETEQGGIRRRGARGIQKTPYTNFPLSITEEQKQQFYDYLDDNNIRSGAAFIRDLMAAVGVFGKPSPEEAEKVIKMIQEAQLN